MTRPAERRRVVPERDTPRMKNGRYDLPATDRGQNENCASVCRWRSQPVEKADALPIAEHIHVLANVTLLVNDPVQHTRRSSPERCQRVADSCARLIDFHDCLPTDRQAKRLRELDRDHCSVMTAAFTQTTGGNPSASSRHVAPSSIEPNSFPLRVPK